MSFAGEVFERLRARRCLRGLDRSDFVDGLTGLLANINALHPFREGNGRTQRAFLTQLSHEAGYELRWTLMDPEVNVEASKAAHQGDNDLLRGLVEPLVRPLHRPPVPRTSSDSGRDEQGD